MTSKHFRISIMLIVIFALVEILVGVFYYFVFFVPKKEMETIRLAQERELKEKQFVQERLLEEAKLREETRMEEIKLEVKQLDLEKERIEKWQEAGEEYERLRQEELERVGKEASKFSCMKIVVENYHNQWNQFCEQLNLPNSCSLPDQYSTQINDDYEQGKKQCENFFD